MFLKVLKKIISVILTIAFVIFMIVFGTISWKSWDPFYRVVSEPGKAVLLVPAILAAIVIVIIVALLCKLFKAKKSTLITLIATIVLALSCTAGWFVGPLKEKIEVPKWSYKYATSDFYGFQPYYVKTGSMTGNLPDDFSAGDAVFCWIVNEPSDVKVGDVISYTVGDPLDRYIVIHRIVDIDEEGYYTFKGDANSEPDMYKVAPSQLQAKYFGKIPKLGYVLSFISDYRIPIFLGIVAVLSFASIFEKDDEEDEDEENQEDVQTSEDEVKPMSDTEDNSVEE